jgi:hypothetical protein
VNATADVSMEGTSFDGGQRREEAGCDLRSILISSVSYRNSYVKCTAAHNRTARACTVTGSTVRPSNDLDIFVLICCGLYLTPGCENTPIIQTVIFISLTITSAVYKNGKRKVRMVVIVEYW